MKKEKIKIGFLRGVNFAKEIGMSDWRIAKFLNPDQFITWVFGKRFSKEIVKIDRVFTFQPRTWSIPIVTTLYLSIIYAVKTIILKLDIVVVNPGFFLSGILIKRIRPMTRVILDIRSIPVENRGILKILSELYFDLIFKLKTFDAVTGISDGMLNDLDERYLFSGDFPTAVWQSGYDDEVFQPVSSPQVIPELEAIRGKFKIMFHGSLSPTRGLREMILALSLLKAKGIEEIALVLIGSGEAKMDLQQTIRDMKLACQVIIIPPMLQEKLPQFLAHADLGIDLLPDHRWWRYQSPLKVYEFLGMGIPVLATDLPCHRNISEAVIIIPNNKPQTIAHKIEKLIQEKNFGELSPIALKDAKKNTWRIRAEILSKFILKIIPA